MNKEGATRPIKPEVDSMILKHHSVFNFVLSRLKNVPRADLESTLKFLPYFYAERFLYYLEHFIRKNQEIELVMKSLYYVLKSYEAQLSTSQTMVQVIYSLNMFARNNLQNYKVKYK